MKIRKCVVCGEYTLKDTHCGKPTLSAHPPKFAREDKYWRERLKARGVKID